MSEEPGSFGRTLAIDFGTVRLGLALSDEQGWVAEPLEVWKRQTLEDDLEHIRAVVESHGVRRVIIGIPFRLDGSRGPSAERAERFIEQVSTGLAPIEVSTQDEALTTWEAESLMKARGLDQSERKRWVDAYAAAVILQEHLDLAQGGRLHTSEPAPGRSGRRRR